MSKCARCGERERMADKPLCGGCMVYEWYADGDVDCIIEETDALRASLAAAKEKLADERKHVAVLAAALEETRCTCESVFVGGMPTALKCTRCRALTAHAARRQEEAR